MKRREDGIKRLKMEQVTLQESNSKYAEKVNNNDCFDFTNLWEKLLSIKAKENMTTYKKLCPSPIFGFVQ